MFQCSLLAALSYSTHISHLQPPALLPAAMYCLRHEGGITAKVHDFTPLPLCLGAQWYFTGSISFEVPLCALFAVLAGFFFFFWVYPCHRERWGGFPHSHYPNNILSFALEEKQQHPEAHRAIFSCSVALTPAWLWNSNGLEMHSEYRDANKHTKSLPRILQRDLS